LLPPLFAFIKAGIEEVYSELTIVSCMSEREIERERENTAESN
jgi:hypothetical protein